MTDGSTNNSGSLIMILIIIAICVVYFVMMKKQKKVFLEGQQELNKIKVGDKVRTRLGIYGVVTEFYETTDGKIARLNISQNDNECIVDVEFRYIMGVDEKKLVELDENNNVISIDGVPVEQLESETIDNTSESELPESDNTSNDNQ